MAVDTDTTNTAVAENLQLNFREFLEGRGFVKTEKFSETYLLSLLTGVPILYYGRGGYGKSEMIHAAFQFVKDASYSVLECDVETTASQIKGGAIARTRKQGREEYTDAHYAVANSMLKKDFFFLEEALDALFSALSVCKSIITSGQLHVNGEIVQSINKQLVCATNVNPGDLLDAVPDKDRNSYEAFLQRFLVVEHEWEDHSAYAYVQLFAARQKPQDSMYDLLLQVTIEDLLRYRDSVKKVIIPQDMVSNLACLASAAAKRGTPVSPRAFIWTTKLMQASAFLDGRGTVNFSDMRVIQYLSYWSSTSVDEIEQEIKTQQEIASAKERIAYFQLELSNANCALKERTNALKNSDFAETELLNLLKFQKEVITLQQSLENSGSYPDTQYSSFCSLREDFGTLVADIKTVVNECF
jgi:MoxR-like ATPase